jgi:hypothetical protein
VSLSDEAPSAVRSDSGLAGFRRRGGALFLVGLLAVLGGNAALVAWRDPLLFWAPSAGEGQPLFYASHYGNFSRHVYTGLMRNLEYDEIWIGPSYAAPFTATDAGPRELMVTMGHMNGRELAQVVSLEASLAKARVVNLVISPLHFTSAHIPGKASFPQALYRPEGDLRYLADFSITRLALVHGTGKGGLDYRSPDYRRTINTRYFWMHDDRARLREFWDTQEYVRGTLTELRALRETLPVAFRLAHESGAVAVSGVMDELFDAIDRLGPEVKVNLILPPTHLTYWIGPAEVVAQGLAVRAEVNQRTQGRAALAIYDFGSDWNLLTDRGLYYDGGHFTNRAVAAMRQAIGARSTRYQAIESSLRRFLATDPAFDEEQMRSIAP